MVHVRKIRFRPTKVCFYQIKLPTIATHKFKKKQVRPSHRCHTSLNLIAKTILLDPVSSPPLFLSLP
jgi:hypothetical protein